MKLNKVHIHFNDTQSAMLQGVALAEGRTVGNLVKSAALQYAAQHKLKLIPEVKYAKFVAQPIKPL